MLVTPDAVAARRAEDALWHATDAVVHRAGAVGALPPPRHPARKAVAHRALAEPRPAPAPPRHEAWVGEIPAAVPPPRGTAGRWAVDLAVPAPHLAAAVGRALGSLPRGLGTTSTEEPGAVVRSWAPWQAAVLAETVERLDQVWPAMLAELRESVSQIVLLGGRAISGFTDFTTHGAVFVNAARLNAGRDGLPGWVRLADALVHEGTHTRCNAAAFSTPFLTSATDPRHSVMTPLRPDPRPLTGLFQQTVVLVRQTLLYRLVHRCAPLSDSQREAVADRRARLLEKAFQGVDTLGRHRAALTPAGEAVHAQAAGLLAEEAERYEARAARLRGGRA
ncbi:aKG-HExxH-type peptide beta-hydroxylase [Streptomyces sp. DT224]|uniref:aKG-HExxH-type peptide beta-hydroxylase n=1 Tax=Streptomyces sp. DT224 TaxID=3393426 RepID=UPI003CF5173B